jgi:hypothetical protein
MKGKYKNKMINKQLENKANDFALEKFDYVINISKAQDFIEITGSIGGDILRYRVYEDCIVEK